MNTIMKNSGRQLIVKKMRDEPFGYDQLNNNYNENILTQQFGSMSIPSDFGEYDMTSNNNTNFGFHNSGEQSSSEFADPVVDLDRMIAETSARWKCTVTAIVSNTVTANTASVSSATINSAGNNPASTNTGTDSLAYFNKVNSGSSTGSPIPQSTSNSTPGGIMESPVVPATTNSSSSLVGLQSASRRPQIATRQNSTGTHSTVMSVPTAMEHQVIEQQQAEIQALHAAIQAQHRQQLVRQSSMNGFLNNRTRSGNFPHQQQQQFHYQQYASSYGRFVPGMSALNENSVTIVEQNNQNAYSFANYGNAPNGGFAPFNPFFVEEKIDCAPVEHIEVNHHDASYWQDDLTVWSGFNTVCGNQDSPSCAEPSRQTTTKKPTNAEDRGTSPTSPIPPSRRRPDAESATGASALNGVPVRVVRDMEVKLASGMTGVTRRALYSGTINAHTRLPEGQGTFVFKKTGDKYQGEVYNGKMHGAGTYTFGNRGNNKSSREGSRPAALKGSFEHNVFIG